MATTPNMSNHPTATSCMLTASASENKDVRIPMASFTWDQDELYVLHDWLTDDDLNIYIKNAVQIPNNTAIWAVRCVLHCKLVSMTM